MVEKTSHINSDHPIKSKDDDALGYWPFAQALAKGLVSRASNDGFVVGIQAKWGMGKTSAVNLMVSAIETEEQHLADSQRTLVVWFNPWLFSGMDSLSKGYLAFVGNSLAKALGKADEGKWSRFKRLIVGGGDMLGDATALGLVAATGGAALPMMGTIKGGVTGATKLAKHLTDAKTLDEISAKTRKNLANLPARIVIVLDDLDRLQPAELMQVLALVKNFGDLPNVIHLLVYDRDIIDLNIRSLVKGSEDPPFIQKIVQAEFDLPNPSSGGMLNLVNEKMGSIFGDVEQDSAWNEIWGIAFRRYLKSPRDVIKLANAFSVSWPSISAEVYPPDFITIELFRSFHRKLYNLIAGNRELLVGTRSFFADNEVKALAEELTLAATGPQASEVLSLICGMFPRLRKHMGNFSSSSRPIGLSTGRQIGTDEGFDSFFRMDPSATAIPVITIRELKNRLNDAAFISQAFLSLNPANSNDASRATSLLDALIDLVETSNDVSINTLEGIAVGSGVSLRIADAGGGLLFEIDNQQRMSILITKIFDKLPVEKLGRQIKAIIANDAADLSVCAFIVAKLTQPLGLVYETNEDDASQLILPKRVLEGIARALSARIKRSAAEGVLLEQPVLWMLLKIWARFATRKSEVADFLNSAASSAEDAKTIVFSAMNITSTSGEGTRRRIDRLPPTNVYDTATLANKVSEHLATYQYNKIDRIDLETFVNSVTLLQQGKRPERF